MKLIDIRTLMKGQVEVILEVSRNDCAVTNSLPEEGCKVERLTIGTTRTLHKVNAEEKDRVFAALLSENLKAKRAGDNSIWVESSSCTPCSFFSKTFSNILGTRSTGKSKILYRILLPSPGDLRSLEKQMIAAGIEYEVVSVIPYMHQELTEREREILSIAMERGYFEDNRRISLTELSSVIGISPSSLSETLRRSLKKSVNFYMDRKP